MLTRSKFIRSLPYFGIRTSYRQNASTLTDLLRWLDCHGSPRIGTSPGRHLSRFEHALGGGGDRVDMGCNSGTWLQHPRTEGEMEWDASKLEHLKM